MPLSCGLDLQSPPGTERPSLGPASRSTDAMRGVRAARVELPARASMEVRVEDVASRLSIGFALAGARDVESEVADGGALYRGALAVPGATGPRLLADVIHRVHAEGIEDYVRFEERPAREEIAYTVDVSRVPGLRLVANTLEFMDDTGTPRLRVAPPYVVDATRARRPAKIDLRGCAHDASPAAPWGRPVTPPGAARCEVRVTWGKDVPYPALVDPAWGSTGSMAIPRGGIPGYRFGHSADLLVTGKLLVAGGFSGAAYLATAELYDPATGTFAAAGTMSRVRAGHTTSVLPSGKVLVAGGFSGDSLPYAELYDPVAGTFAPTGSMATPRSYHAAATLASGKVLVTGGEYYDGASFAFLDSAEIFDPAAGAGAGAFVATGAMGDARSGHTSSLLPGGKVLVAGGIRNGSSGLASAAIFDPAPGGGAGAFSPTGSMGTGRYLHAAVALPSGKVLVAGGVGAGAEVFKSAEIFDPAASAGVGAFGATGSMAERRRYHALSVLPSGKVLVTAGQPGTSGALGGTELFDPAGGAGAGAFSPAGSMITERYTHTATALPSGKVIVTGGRNDIGTYYLASAEQWGGAPGEACSTGAYCVSGACAHGLCCDRACDGGACERCDLPGKEGKCTVVPQGATKTATTCPPPYACNGMSATCPTSCSSDASCAAAYFCDAASVCLPRRPQGAACGPTHCRAPGCRECTSSFCVDGVCCDEGCAEPCRACRADLKQSDTESGACGPVKDGTDPHDGCAVSATACGPDGQCNGTGACRPATPSGVACAEGKVCDGRGACAEPLVAVCDGDHRTTSPNGTVRDCAPYRCRQDGTCRAPCENVTDCVAPAVCDSTGACVSPPTAPAEGSGACATARARGASRGLVMPALLGLAVAIAALRSSQRHTRSEGP